MPGGIGAGALTGIGIDNNTTTTATSSGGGNSNWLSNSLQALPGTLQGVSQVIYAGKGISQAPNYYVTQQPTGGNSRQLLIFAVVGLVAIALVFLLMRKS